MLHHRVSTSLVAFRAGFSLFHRALSAVVPTPDRLDTQLRELFEPDGNARPICHYR
jgi:hypothetical protein